LTAKWGLIIGAALSSLALAACGGSDDSVSNEGNEELFTTAGFQKAYDAVKEKAGENAQVLQVRITEGGADFKLRNGEQATGFVYTGGDLHDEKVDVIGPGSLEGQDFPISEVDPAAVNKIVDGIKSQPQFNDLKVTVMTLEKSQTDGNLKWTINGEGGGRTGLVYTAEPDGSGVSLPALGPNEDLAKCIRDAGTDVSKIQACTQ
jgi:hypothetical protein